MNKEQLLKKLSELIAKTSHDDKINEMLRQVFNYACDNQVEFSQQKMNIYDEIINRLFDCDRISTKRVTASDLCIIAGLEKNQTNVVGIARALRRATGRDSFKSNGVVYNLLPFFKDGTIG